MSQRHWNKPIDFKVGDYVLLTGKEGYIRYIGERLHHHGTWYGIELIIGNGPNDGSEHGERYFSCRHRKGIFIRSSSIKCKMNQNEHGDTYYIDHHPHHNNYDNHKKTYKRSNTRKSLLKSPQKQTLKPIHSNPTNCKHKISRSRSFKLRSKSREDARISNNSDDHNNNNNNNNNKNDKNTSFQSRFNLISPRSSPSNSRSKSAANIGKKHKDKISKIRLTESENKLKSKHKLKSSNSSHLKLKRSKSKHNKSKSISPESKSNHNKYRPKSAKSRRQDSNIKPSAYIKHKKKLSITNNYNPFIPRKNKKNDNNLHSLNGTGHFKAKSMNVLDDKQKNESSQNDMFDLQAILNSNDLDPLYDEKKNRKKKRNEKNINNEHCNYNKHKSPPPKPPRSTKSKPKPPPKRENQHKKMNKKRVKEAPKRRKQGLFKQQSYNENDIRFKRKRRSISKYRKREIMTDNLDDIGFAKTKTKRSKSTNSLSLSIKTKKSKKHNGFDTDISDDSDDSDDGWKCYKCLRLNVMEFKFCPNCGTKKHLKGIKYTISVDSMELKQGSDEQELSESDSDDLDRFIKTEENEMQSILNEMKFEDDKKMEQIQQEREELHGLKKKDYIKTFDDIQQYKDRKSSSSSTLSGGTGTPSPPLHAIHTIHTNDTNDTKEKVQKLKLKKSSPFSIKNWILSPKSMGNNNNNNNNKGRGIWSKSPKQNVNYNGYASYDKYDDTMNKMGINIHNNNNKENMNAKQILSLVDNDSYKDRYNDIEESINSDISHAYSIGMSPYNDGDRLKNMKSTANYKHTLDLIPDTPQFNEQVEINGFGFESPISCDKQRDVDKYNNNTDTDTDNDNDNDNNNDIHRNNKRMYRKKKKKKRRNNHSLNDEEEKKRKQRRKPKERKKKRKKRKKGRKKYKGSEDDDDDNINDDGNWRNGGI